MSAFADRGRTAVGAAEIAAFDGTELMSARPLDELARLAAALADGEWWRATQAPIITVGASRRSAHSSSAAGADGRVRIRLAPGQHDVATLAHELAHALAGVEHGHDGRFRRAELDVVAVLAGRDRAAYLEHAFTDFGLPTADRLWPPPVVTLPTATHARAAGWQVHLFG